MNIKHRIPDSSRLPNYFAIISIAPAVISVMAYELVDYMIMVIHPERTDYHPIDGLGILIPMALMMELFSFFLTHHLMKKIKLLTDAIKIVASGNYNIALDEEKSAPLKDVVHDFNMMTEELQSVQTLRTDFISDFSHEFKTPIVSINGFANLLLDSSVTEEDRQEYLQIIAEESDRLAHLAEQTMLMSKLDSQAIIPSKKNYSLDEQIKQKIILLSQLWEGKNITMDIDLSPVTYYGNPDLMSHIWINMLNNSIKYTPENGTIKITLQEKTNNVVFTISDTGNGMTEKEQKQIFNRFYQADLSHSTKGLGLGLAIVHRIIELSEGEISVTSFPGQGSTFTVLLPQTSDLK